MDFLITKASDDYWFTIKHYVTIEEVMKHYPVVVIQNNLFTDIDDLMTFWEGMDYASAVVISKIKYNIIIYDDYIE